MCKFTRVSHFLKTWETAFLWKQYFRPVVTFTFKKNHEIFITVFRNIIRINSFFSKNKIQVTKHVSVSWACTTDDDFWVKFCQVILYSIRFLRLGSIEHFDWTLWRLCCFIWHEKPNSEWLREWKFLKAFVLVGKYLNTVCKQWMKNELWHTSVLPVYLVQKTNSGWGGDHITGLYIIGHPWPKI